MHFVCRQVLTTLMSDGVLKTDMTLVRWKFLLDVHLKIQRSYIEITTGWPQIIYIRCGLLNPGSIFGAFNLLYIFFFKNGNNNN